MAVQSSYMNEQSQIQFLIKLFMPIALALYIFSFVSALVVFSNDLFFSKIEQGSSFIWLMAFIYLLFGGWYCYKYLKNNMNYFQKNSISNSHTFFLVLIPIFLGLSFSIQFIKKGNAKSKGTQNVLLYEVK